MFNKQILHFNTIDSTNEEAKRLIKKGKGEEGLVIVADEQTAGRGRFQKKWISPKGKGVYLSVILKPSVEENDLPQITPLAAVSVVEAIKDVAGLESKIKWPNDVLVNGKKVCGILTEVVSSGEHIPSVVVGIGVNVSFGPSDFPEGLDHPATSIEAESGEKIDRRRFTEVILEKLDFWRRQFLDGARVLKENDHLVITGKNGKIKEL